MSAVQKRCPDVVYGQHSLAESDGRCRYCRRKVEAALPRPDNLSVSRLSEAYALMYDPDYTREDWAPHD